MPAPQSYTVNRTTVLDAALWNKIVAGDIAARLAAIETLKPAIDAALFDLREVGLARLDSVLLPAMEKILAVSSLGFLVATSATEVVLEESTTAHFTIDEGAERDLFTPPPFLVLQHDDVVEDYAIAQLIDYDREHGELAAEIVSIVGDPGPFDDWVISGTPGAALAMINAAATTLAARDETVEARDEAVPAAADASASKIAAAASAAAAAASAIAAALFDPSTYYTKTQIDTFLADLVAGAPGALNTLKELADALGDDANFSATISSLIATKIAIADIATLAQWRNNTASKILSTDKVWSSADFVALTDQATIATDLDDGWNRTLTIAGNRTLGAPTHTKNGLSGVIVIKQDATGSRTLSYNSVWKFVAGSAPILSTAANAEDWLFFQVKSSTFIVATLLKDVK